MTLIVGDVLVILILTVAGFASHGETDWAYLSRMAAVFFPMLFCWFWLASMLGLFDMELISMPRTLWRVIFAGVFATPLAAVIRAVLLNEAILPVFVLVLMTVHSLGLLIWRGIYLLRLKRPV